MVRETNVEFKRGPRARNARALAPERDAGGRGSARVRAPERESERARRTGAPRLRERRERSRAGARPQPREPSGERAIERRFDPPRARRPTPPERLARSTPTLARRAPARSLARPSAAGPAMNRAPASFARAKRPANVARRVAPPHAPDTPSPRGVKGSKPTAARSKRHGSIGAPITSPRPHVATSRPAATRPPGVASSSRELASGSPFPSRTLARSPSPLTRMRFVWRALPRALPAAPRPTSTSPASIESARSTS